MNNNLELLDVLSCDFVIIVIGFFFKGFVYLTTHFDYIYVHICRLSLAKRRINIF